MKTVTSLFVVLVLMLVIGRAVSAAADTNALVWEAESKEYTSKPGERYAEFKFWFTNTSKAEVLIIRAQSSCFCTVAQLPSTP